MAQAEEQGSIDKARAAEQGRLDTQEAQGAANVQQAVMAGDQVAQQREMDKQSTLLGMDQAAYAGAQERVAGYEAAQMDALSSGLSAAGSMLGGV